MALVEGCKHALEITVPLVEVEQETERVIANIQKKVRLPGFRPGKAPASLIKSRFASEIRQDVLENLVPRFFRKAVEDEHLQVVGQPGVSDVKFEAGQPIRFKAEFEVAPTFELGEYRGIEISYKEPEIGDEALDKRLEEIREQKAEYVTIEPRPIADGDFAVVSLHSVSGVDEPIAQDELTLHIGDEATLAAFTENLRGVSPEEEKEFDVTYPEEYDRKQLAGRTIRFKALVKAVRKKELPELNDEFAKDLGDYQSLGELREAVGKALFEEEEHKAQQEAKTQLVDKLVEAHDFPIPKAFIDRQIENNVEQQLKTLASQGIDPRTLKLDWQKVREAQLPRAAHDVKASLLLEKIADREGIDAMQEEVDREVHHIARQQREPVAAVRAKLQKDGTLRRIAGHIRTEKTLNFLFEHARKTAG